MSNIISSTDRPMRGPIPISSIIITPLLVGPYTFQLHIESGPYTFTGNFDNTMRSYMEVCSAAMKFFGVKYGLITLDKEGIVRATNKRKNHGY